MFSRSPEGATSDPATAPLAGLREPPLTPPAPQVPLIIPGSSPADDSVIAHGDHVEGAFTSRGTVRIMGSLKGRVEAVRVQIEEGASVEADVVVEEAIIAGGYVGALTCRQRLEVRPSGQLSGRVETYRLMLHEGASVEGEMHMLPQPGRPEGGGIRGSAPVRGVAPATATRAPAAAVLDGSTAALRSPAAEAAPMGATLEAPSLGAQLDVESGVVSAGLTPREPVPAGAGSEPGDRPA